MKLELDQHPDPERLQQFVQGRLSDDELEAIQAHLESCDECCRRIASFDNEDAFVQQVKEVLRPEQGVTTAHNLENLTDTEDRISLSAPIPKRIRDYEIQEEASRGGMGVVYKAVHQELNRTVALKMILSQDVASTEQIMRFRLEAEMAAQCQHPNIAAIYEVGTYGDRPFIAMEWIDGGSLAEALARQPHPVRESVELLQTIARALHAAHSQGIIHRDLKPTNILLRAPGVPVICDFGLARSVRPSTQMTATGLILGTPEYMSPEQAGGGGDAVGTASDIFSLGVIFYRMLTGALPFRGESVLEIIRAVQESEPVRVRKLNPRAPLDLEVICLKCLEKDPEKRYSTAEELADDLRRWQEGRPILARPIGTRARVIKWMKRNPLLAGFWILVLVLIGTLSIGGPLVAWHQSNLREQKELLAIKNGNLAVENARLARREKDARLKIEKQLRLSTALRLTALSRELRLSFPQESLLLAIEAVETTRRMKEPVAGVVHQNLRDAVGGIQESREIRGPAFPILSMAISSDERWLAAGSMAGQFYLWDLHRGEDAPPVMKINQQIAVGLKFSPDNRWLACGGSKPAIWDLTKSKLDRVSIPHRSLIQEIAFDPSSQVMATQGRDGAILLWRAQAGPLKDPEHQLQGAPPSLYGSSRLRFSSDGQWLYSRNRKWNLAGDKPEEHRYQMTDIPKQLIQTAVSREGRWLAISNRTGLYLWDRHRVGDSAPVKLAGHQGLIRALAFTPSGKWLVSAGQDKTARLWSLTEAKPATRSLVLKGHESAISCLAVSPNGRWLATGSHDKTIRLWDLRRESPQETVRVLRGHSGGLMTLGFSANGTLVSGSMDRTLRLWRVERDSSNVLMRRKKAQTQSGLLSSDGRWLVLPSLNGEMILTNLREKRQHRIPKENGGGKTLALTANAKWLLTHRTERLGRRRRISQITRWNLQADTPVADRSLDGVSLPPAVIESSASPLSADGRWLVCLSLRGQRMKGAQMVDLSLTEPKVVAAIPILKRKPLFAMISEQGNWVATVENNQTHLWRWKGDGIAKRPVFSIPGSHPVISRDEKRVAVANRQGAILLYRWTRTGPAAEKPRKLDLGGHLFQIHFTPDNQWLVAAGSQNRIHLWNLAREEKAEVLVAPDSGFTRLALSADGRWIAAGSTSEVHIWDLSQKSIPSSRLRIANIPSFVQTMAFQDSGPGLITDSADGATRSWALKLTSTLEQAKKQARRSLTPQEKRRYLIPTQPQGVNR